MERGWRRYTAFKQLLSKNAAAVTLARFLSSRVGSEHWSVFGKQRSMFGCSEFARLPGNWDDRMIRAKSS